MNITETMGKDQFLMLFTRQLQYQDPLNPMDSTAFTAQLAQFSSLEQLFDVNANLQNITAVQNELYSGLGAGLIGREVVWSGPEGNSTGVVTGVKFDGGATYLMTDTGEYVALGDINEIRAIQ